MKQHKTRRGEHNKLVESPVDPMASHYNKRDFSTVAGVGLDTVNRWLRDGLPKEQLNGRVIISRVKAVEWLGLHGHAKQAMRFRLPPDAGTAKPRQKKKNSMAGDDFLDQLARAREVEQESYNAWYAAEEVNRPMLQDLYLKAQDGRRKLEKDWITIQLAQGNIVSKSDVERELSIIAEKVKSTLQSMPGSVAPMCEGKTAAQINAILKSEIDTILHDMAVEMQEIKE